jgi:hypothetical protein
MWRKTALKRLAKIAPIGLAAQRVIDYDNETFTDLDALNGPAKKTATERFAGKGLSPNHLVRIAAGGAQEAHDEPARDVYEDVADDDQPAPTPSPEPEQAKQEPTASPSEPKPFAGSDEKSARLWSMQFMQWRNSLENADLAIAIHTHFESIEATRGLSPDAAKAYDKAGF